MNRKIKILAVLPLAFLIVSCGSAGKQMNEENMAAFSGCDFALVSESEEYSLYVDKSGDFHYEISELYGTNDAEEFLIQYDIAPLYHTSSLLSNDELLQLYGNIVSVKSSIQTFYPEESLTFFEPGKVISRQKEIRNPEKKDITVLSLEKSIAFSVREKKTSSICYLYVPVEVSEYFLSGDRVMTGDGTEMSYADFRSKYAENGN